MDEEDLPAPDWNDPAIIAARKQVERAIGEYLAVLRAGMHPYPVAWVVGVEWTNPDIEQNHQAARDVISPDEQTISASAGLGAYILDRYR
jgi:hypothetical protein